ncbi:MAG: metalloregulator ArsR/SmtB family transcription factor [Candidatus Saccharimonadales bacterium]
MKTAIARQVNLTKHEEHLVSILQLLGDKTRYKIFKILLSKKEYCVSEVADMVGISVPAASQHFRLFELVGLVDKKRYSQMICYVLKDDEALVQDLVKFAGR